MLGSLGKMADPRAQEVVTGDCGPIPGQHTLTAVFRSIGDFPKYGRLLRLLSLIGKLVSGGGRIWKMGKEFQYGRPSDGFL